VLRLASLLLSVAIALPLVGCQQAPHVGATPAAPPATARVDTSVDALTAVAPRHVSLDQAVRTLVDRADTNDVAYFRQLAQGGDVSARYWITQVKRSQMLARYRALVQVELPFAYLDFHLPRCHFMVKLERLDGDWVVRHIGYIA
jgi:hypothetical protein